MGAEAALLRGPSSSSQEVLAPSGGGAAATTASSPQQVSKAPLPPSTAVAVNGTAGQPVPAATTAPVAQKRARLDVGFASFEKSLGEDLSASIESQKTAMGSAWSEGLRSQLTANVTEAVRAALDAQLKPLKVEIGHTWMVFSDDSTKDKYVEQLRSGFGSVLERARGTLKSHMDLSLKNLALLAGDPARKDGEAAESQLLVQTERTIEDGLLKEHCYGDAAKRRPSSTKLAAGVNNATKSSPAAASSGNFCIPSIVQGLVHRLNDTLQLVSMTMKFEARALAMVQEEAGKKKKTVV